MSNKIGLNIKTQNNLFDIVLYITYFLYILIIFGISNNAPSYLDIIQYFMQLYISIILLIRFNPFKVIEFTDFDKKIVFNAGFFLLTTLLINNRLFNYITEIKNLL
jgi:hypothetical protein